jgi:hypothetical protein
LREEKQQTAREEAEQRYRERIRKEEMESMRIVAAKAIDDLEIALIENKRLKEEVQNLRILHNKAFKNANHKFIEREQELNEKCQKIHLEFCEYK